MASDAATANDAATAGDAGSGFAGSCTFEGQFSCVDYIGPYDTPQSAQADCSDAGEVYSPDHCSSVDLIAICDQPPWKVHFYYEGRDITFGEFSCGQIGGTWILVGAGDGGPSDAAGLVEDAMSTSDGA